MVLVQLALLWPLRDSGDGNALWWRRLGLPAESRTRLSLSIPQSLPHCGAAPMRLAQPEDEQVLARVCHELYTSWIANPQRSFKVLVPNLITQRGRHRGSGWKE